ncbi:MAG: hypothetical protein ACTSPG_05875 [Candidatus Hodarchaeales archaeon]
MSIIAQNESKIIMGQLLALHLFQSFDIQMNSIIFTLKNPAIERALLERWLKFIKRQTRQDFFLRASKDGLNVELCCASNPNFFNELFTSGSGGSLSNKAGVSA